MMMMAHDSSPTPPSGLADETTEAVRAALVAYLRSSGSSTELRAALNRMADEARTKAILPEHLLIMLKRLWSSLPEVRSVGDADEQTKVLQRVVTMCIREYYG
jgi:hemoglobin-like flavoprotein